MATFPSIEPLYNTQETVKQDYITVKLGGSVNINVNVDASGSEVEGSDARGNELGQQIAIAIQSEIIKQKRSGGLLAP